MAKPPPAALANLSDDDLDKAKFDLDAQVIAARDAMSAIQREQDRRADELVKRRQTEGGQRLGPAAIPSEEHVTLGDADG